MMYTFCRNACFLWNQQEVTVANVDEENVLTHVNTLCDVIKCMLAARVAVGNKIWRNYWKWNSALFAFDGVFETCQQLSEGNFVHIICRYVCTVLFTLTLLLSVAKIFEILVGMNAHLCPTVWRVWQVPRPLLAHPGTFTYVQL